MSSPYWALSALLSTFLVAGAHCGTTEAQGGGPGPRVARLPSTSATAWGQVDDVPVGQVGAPSPEESLPPSLGDWEGRSCPRQFSSVFWNDRGACYPSAHVHGRFMADSVWFHQGTANRNTVGDIEDGCGFRRARLAAHGWVSPVMEYEVEMDFAQHGDAPDVKDAWMAVHNLPWVGNVKVGHFKEPFSLEELITSRFITFMERGLPNEFTPGRNLGIAAYHWSPSKSMTWAIGGFRTGSDSYGDDAGDEGEQAVTGRITFLPWYDRGTRGRRLFHLGAAYSFRDADEDEVRFRTRPEIYLNADDEGKVPRFVDTKDIPATSHELFGAEAALVYGSLSIQSEYLATAVHRIDGETSFFHGAYAYASYFLTGECRPYDRNIGEFDRVVPFEDFFCATGSPAGFAGKGAWELAARWSYIDLNDDDVEGGRLNNFSLGVNWYLNPFARIMFNYIHADLDDPSDGRSDADVFATRAQIDF